MCLHTVILDPANPGRIYIAISAAGAFRIAESERRAERPTEFEPGPASEPQPRGQLTHLADWPVAPFAAVQYDALERKEVMCSDR